MKRLFDALPDETPPTTGAEIGEALAPALEAMAKASERQAETISQALTDALKAIAADRAQQIPAAPIARWVFDVVRDDEGRMTQVIASANTLQ